MNFSIRSATDSFARGEKLLVIAKDQYGDGLYFAESLEELYDACYAIIDERKDYYYAPEKPDKPSVTEELANSLPEGAIKEMALEEQESYKKEISRYQEEFDNFSLLDKARQGDERAAFIFLKNRTNHEYEGVELQVLRKAPKRNITTSGT